MSLYPLPPLVKIENFNNCDMTYKNELLRIFKETIQDSSLNFLGIPIRWKKLDIIDDYPNTLWHLISCDKFNKNIDTDRVIDSRRCERLPWIAHIIKNYSDKNVKYWKNSRKSDKDNFIIWLEAERYMIVLSHRKSKENGNYYLLKTAYVHEEWKVKRNLQEAHNYLLEKYNKIIDS